MATRMERYYKQNSSNNRSERNQNLYREIYETSSYSNIEGVATIENSNEIDITKIKKMLKNREDYQKQKDVRKIMIKEEPKEEVKLEEPEEDKNYDIRDILDKARINKPKENKYRRLENTNYGILKKIDSNKKLNLEDDVTDSDLRSLIDTINNNSELNKLGDKELSLDLLDDLKSENNTMIDKDNSIKKLLEEAKQESKKDDTSDLDKSFFTSSLNFGKDDFEELANLNSIIKKKNSFSKIIIFVVLLCITIGIIFLVYSLIK